jgi:DNA (cytosine-5)-methyltransferase 1
MRVRSGRELSVISLFSGAGGLDYGFEAAGFKTHVALEVDPVCCASLRASRPWPLLETDLLTTSTESLLSAGGLQAGCVDVLIGGPPCQPFSKSGWWASGDSLRLDDARAGTLGGYLRVLREARPRTFLLENVEGLAFAGKDEGLRLFLSTVNRINSEAGTSYQPTVHVLNAADYGVPQTRTRVFIVGARDGRPFYAPRSTHIDPERAALLGLAPWMTAWDAVGGMGRPNEAGLEVTGKWADLLPTIPEGQNYLWHTDRMGGEPLFGWRRRYWNFLLKLAKSRPSWTIQAQPGPATGPFHWQNRRLSTAELLRLQTFPRNAVVLGGRGEVQRQLGNAVPSLLAEVIAREIAAQLLDVPINGKSPLLLPKRRTRVPPSEPCAPVPKKYLSLRGRHAPHPGTGAGPLHAPIPRAPSVTDYDGRSPARGAIADE